LAIKLACKAQSPKCLNDAYNQLSRYINGEGSITKGFEEIVICNAIRGSGKQTEWYNLFRKMQASEDSTFRTQIINGLGCSDDSDLIKEYLETTLGTNANTVYSQTERQAVFKSVLSSDLGLQAALSFLVQNELDILRRLGYNDIESLVTEIAREVRTTTEQDLLLDNLVSLSLSDEALLRVKNVIETALAPQQTSKYAIILELIETFVDSFDSETTVIETSTDAVTSTISSVTETTGTTGATQSSTNSVEETTTDGANIKSTNFLIILVTATLVLVFKLVV